MNPLIKKIDHYLIKYQNPIFYGMLLIIGLMFIYDTWINPPIIIHNPVSGAHNMSESVKLFLNHNNISGGVYK
jgi:hypothetical protein